MAQVAPFPPCVGKLLAMVRAILIYPAQLVFTQKGTGSGMHDPGRSFLTLLITNVLHYSWLLYT